MARAIDYLKSLLLILTVLIVMLPVIVAMWVLSLVSLIPSVIGRHLSVEEAIRVGLNRTFDVEEMKAKRDEIYHAYRPYAEADDSLERWYIVREMENTLDTTKERIKSGEYILTFLFGSLSVAAGIVGPPILSALVIFFATIMISTLVLVRTIAIDILSFDPRLYLEESSEELAMRLLWNKGPMSGKSAMLITLIAIIDSGSLGYDIGMRFTEMYASRIGNHEEGRWRANERDENE